MAANRIELWFRDGDGASHTLTLRDGEVRTQQRGIALAARAEQREGRVVIRASVSNRSGSAVHLDAAWFHLATGFPADVPARFFKHGYQSWSASHPVAVGTLAHPRDQANFLVRLNHQSEVRRGEHAPEAATSELFTIVESDSSYHRFIAGFIGAAHQLTTITVTTPDTVAARAILDGTILRSGEDRELEPIACWRSDESAARIASRWAAMLGGAMNARVDAPYQRGWCSWYHYFHAISEEALMANLRALKSMRSAYPIEVVQLDDGFQAALGDWDRTNAKFPSGLKQIADQIRDAGFSAGLWVAPFLAARDSQLMREHPDWFIKHDNGEPLRAGFNPNWSTDADKSPYALDPSNPDFTAHLERLFKKVVHRFGFDYLKLDFLYAAAAQGIRYNPNLTRAETLRHGLAAIRRGAGEKAFILGCGCPLGPAVGIVDGMRIGPDVAPYWGAGAGEIGAPGTALAIDAIVARSFMHRRLWLNDPDCLMLRAKETALSADERHALAMAIAASGGMLLISDDMALLGGDSAKLFQAVAKIGAEVDAGSKTEPPMAANLMALDPVRIVSAKTAGGGLHLILNMGDAATVRLADALPPHSRASIIGAESGDDTTGTIEMAPHSATIVRTS